MHNVSNYFRTVLYSKEATDITKYPKLSKKKSLWQLFFYFRDFLNVFGFSSDWISSTVVQMKFQIFEGTKNFPSARNLISNIAFWYEHWFRKVRGIFSVRSLWQSYPNIDYTLLFFILLFKISHFSGKISMRLKWLCLWK